MSNAMRPSACKCGTVTGTIADDKVVCSSCGEKRANIATSTAKFLANVVQLFGEPVEPTIFRSKRALEKIKQQDEYLKRRRTPTGQTWFEVITDPINGGGIADEPTSEISETED